MSIEVSLQAAGTSSGDGTITPSANGTITITPRAGTTIDLSVDYSAPDAVVVSVDGSFTVLHDRLTLRGGLSANVFDGATNLDGKISYAISKDVSANVSASVGASGTQVGAGVVIRF
jgi:hypothetical protein